MAGLDNDREFVYKTEVKNFRPEKHPEIQGMTACSD
jgi:hypothetical protein